MNDNTDAFLLTDGGCYLESLIKSRHLALLSEGLPYGSYSVDIVEKLNEIIDIELELALVESKKALSKVQKDNVTTLKKV